MRWQECGESENVEDQRGLPVGMALGGAGNLNAAEPLFRLPYEEL
jgi:hypothetical protein